MSGYLEIVFGPMFSGKTTLLLEKINNYITYSTIKKYDKKILIINNILDTRKNSASNKLTTHKSFLKRNLESSFVSSIKVKNLADIDEDFIDKYDYIAIDECQFFEDLEEKVKDWLAKDKYIYCTGLIADSEKNIFGHLHQLFSKADNIVQLKAYCVECNSYIKNAVFTKWINSKNKDSPVQIGGSDNYVPVCGRHY